MLCKFWRQLRNCVNKPCAARGESYSDATLRAARGLVRFAEPLLIMAALFAAPIITKEISRCRAITD